MFDFIYSAGAFIVALGILITFHEFGHFWVARRFGVKVLRFSIGFGRPLWQRKVGPDQMELVVAALPLGGYVRMLDEREGEVAPEERHRAFNTQPLGARAAVVAAGPIFNFLLAIIVYWLMFVIGVQGLKPIVGEATPGSAAAEAGIRQGDRIVSVEGRKTPTWEAATLEILEGAMEHNTIPLQVLPKGEATPVTKVLDVSAAPPLEERGNVLENVGLSPGRPHLPPVIDKVTSGKAAEEAGLKPGDRVVAVDGEPVESWSAWVDLIRSRPGQAMETEVERDGRNLTLVMVPRRHETEKGEVVGKIGVAVRVPDGFEQQWRAEQQYAPLQALERALAKTWDMSALTLRVLGKMVMLEASVKNLSGPISIAQYAGQSASIGLAQFLAFLGLVSLSLGILNLLPIPILDGGHLLYYLIELVKGSPVSEETMMWGQKLGAVFLVLLMTVAVYNDLVRLVTD